MRNVIIDGLSLLRIGDFSLISNYAEPSLFWKDFGLVNVQTPGFEDAGVSEAATVGDTVLLLGGVANLLVKGVFVLENWFWQTEFGKSDHLILFSESERRI